MRGFEKIDSIVGVIGYAMSIPLDGGCNDLIFSGHTCVAFMACLLLARHRGGWITVTPIFIDKLTDCMT